MMRLLVLSLLFFVTLSATENLAERYRHDGLGAVERALDNQLATPAHWKEVFKTHDVVYGFFDRPTDLLICSKAEKKLELYRANGRFELRHTTPIILGAMPGDKVKEGDLRTPVGVYKIVDRLENPGPEYGPLALVTDYPNRYDRILGKNGHGIWLHGYPFDCDDKNATKGCIAVKNDTLVALDAKMDYRHALLIIADAPLPKVDRDTLANLLAFLFDWRRDWKYNRFDAYLGHYAPDLVFKEKYDFDDFKKYKRAVFAKNEGLRKRLGFTDLKVLPYPNSHSKKLWYVSFFETYRCGDYRFDGTKELLVEELSPGRFAIVVE